MDQFLIVQRIVRGVLRRRKRLALITAVVTAAVALPIAYYMSQEPPRFRTNAIVLLETRPDRVPLFQEFSPYRPLPVQAAILRSRSLAESVLENLPKSSLQDLIENPYYVDWEQSLRNAYFRWRGKEPEIESPQRRALTELQQARVNFDLRLDGIVVLTAEASKPQVAVDIANTYVEALMSRTRSFNIDDARVTREFLETQLADVKKNLGTSEETLRSFVNAHGGLKIPERSQATVSQLSQAEMALSEVEASRKMLEARLDALRQKVETQKRVAASTPAPAAPVQPRQPSAEIQRLRAQLTQMESTLLELRARFTDEHPRIRLVKDRIAELQSQLGDAIKDSGPVVAAPGAVPSVERVNFAEQLVSMEASFHAVSAQEQALRKQVDSLRQSVKGLSSSEMEYSRLTRETESSRNLYAMLSDKLTAARIREQGEMKVVKVIDPPSYPVRTVSQRRVRFMLGALGVAVMVGLAVPAGVEWFRRRVETDDDIELGVGLPVLATIPRMSAGRAVFLPDYDATTKHPSDQMIFTEAFRSLRVSIQLAQKIEGIRTLLVTSPFAHEGKSTVVVNLGLAFSEVGTRVVIMDSDLHRPMLHRALKVAQGASGLVKALHSEQPVDDALTQVGKNFWLMPRGTAVYPHTRGVLATGRVKELIGETADRAELVICDSSPVLLVPDNVFLASAVDGIILVAKAGSTTTRDLVRAKQILEGAGGKILGVIINEMPIGALRGYYKRYYYSYVKKGA